MALDRFKVNDDFAEIFDRLFAPSYSLPSFQGNLTLVNKDEYDIIPRRSKIEKDIKAKEAEIARTEQLKKNDMQFYDSRIKSLKLELDQLRARLSP